MSVYSAYKIAHRVRMLCNTPLPPHCYWKRHFNGITVTEAFLYLWIVSMEVRSKWLRDKQNVQNPFLVLNEL